MRGYTSISALLRSFSVCQQFLTVPLQLAHREETHTIKRDARTKSQKKQTILSSLSVLNLIILAYSPYLSVGGWSLSDDGAGLRRGQGLLDHYAGIVVAHP